MFKLKWLVILVWFLLAASTAYATNITFTLIDVPGAYSTEAYGINDSGEIVGIYTKARFHGFIYSAGNFSSIDVPGAYLTYALGINNSGEIVGSYSNKMYGTIHGFLYKGGIFTQIDVPGANMTAVVGNNDSGEIVGGYSDDKGPHGFLYRGGNFISFDIPGATDGIFAYDINNSGHIVGSYYYGSGTGAHGFVITHVPEPATMLLLGSGLIGLIGLRRKFRK